MSSSIMALNPLATPKGFKYLCELCQKPAYTMCTTCRYTYYCSEAHKDEDWLAIHEKICHLITLLRCPQPHANSEEERQHLRQQQLLRRNHIVKLALQEGRKFLCEDQSRLAIPAALEALKFLTEIHGAIHVQLTPAYLILAEAAIGLNRLTDANQYLSQAQWSVLKASDEVSPLMKSSLHRNLGQLAAAKNNLEEAKKHFAEDVYQASLACSPDGVEAAGGYYHLAGVFLRDNKPAVAISLQDKVVSIWCTHLKKLLASFEEVLAKISPLARGQYSLPGLEPHQVLNPSLLLDVSKTAEASSTLHGIRQLKELETPPPPASHLVSVYFALALLHTVTRKLDEGLEYGKKALKLSLDSQEEEVNMSYETDDKVSDIKNLLKIISELKLYLQA